MFRASLRRRARWPLLAVALAAFLLPPASGTAFAQQRRPPAQERPRAQPGPRPQARPRPQVPRRGTIIRTLPTRHSRIVIRGGTYFYWGGIFYRTGPGGYVVVSAPVGAVIGVLPPGYVRVYVGPIRLPLLRGSVLHASGE